MSKAFAISKKPRRKAKLVFPEKIRSLQAAGGYPEPRPVQGIMPDSKEEWWVALALYKLGFKDDDFVFQVGQHGGRSVRGGQVVDFWIWTVPLPSILMINGWYWHYLATRRYDTLLAIAALERYYAGRIAGVFEIIDVEIPTPDMALQVVRRKLKV